MRLEGFWYVAAETRELRAGTVLSRSILGEWLAIFRDADGKPAALQDKCLHRGSRLSRGHAADGCLRCPYHGWTYSGDGAVAAIPSEGPGGEARIRKRVPIYETLEREGYVYVRLSQDGAEGLPPRPQPHYGEPGWRRIRLVNRFKSPVHRCAENFLDIPHTVFVHPGIFRNPRGQAFTATVERKDGEVHVEYHGETDNFGLFSAFLNPGGKPIVHRDHFLFPNVTWVEYHFGGGRSFHITSQCVPTGEGGTVVYTDLAYRYGFWNLVAGPIIRRQGQAIIDQDVRVLDSQHETAEKYGEAFIPMPADTIHLYVDAIWEELQAGRDPRLLPGKRAEIAFRA